LPSPSVPLPEKIVATAFCATCNAERVARNGTITQRTTGPRREGETEKSFVHREMISLVPLSPAEAS